ncbi:hypothetical protein PTKIN_Ptkin16aG0108900 [Pterospermum kingtungense]
MTITINRCGEFFPRPFGFEAMWLMHNGCEQVVNDAWKNNIRGSHAFVLMNKIKVTNQAMQQWNKAEFENIFARRAKLESDKLLTNKSTGESCYFWRSKNNYFGCRSLVFNGSFKVIKIRG